MSTDTPVVRLPFRPLLPRTKLALIDLFSLRILALPHFYVGLQGKEFKPYYAAHTKIQSLALLDEKYKGSNWRHLRTR